MRISLLSIDETMAESEIDSEQKVEIALLKIYGSSLFCVETGLNPG